MRLVLTIEKRKQNEVLVLLVLVIVFCLALLQELLKLPGAVKYSIDILWMLLFGTIAVNKFNMPNVETFLLLKRIVVFFLFTLFGVIVQGGSFVLYIWGFRNYFRFFVYFLSCAMFLKRRTVDQVLDLFDKLFYLNFVVSLIQFFVMGKVGDYNGGIFGTGEGCNGKLIVFMIIVLAKSVLRYSNNQESRTVFLTKLLIAVVVSALAELKFFYVLILIVVICSSVLTKASGKTFLIILISGLGLYLGGQLLVYIYPNWKDFFSLRGFLGEAISSSGYTGKGDMNRLTVFPITWTLFLDTWPKRLLGLGMGNCDTSAFSLFNSPFFKSYGYLHYNWFSSAFIFLETGVVGAVLYFSFFIFVFKYAGDRRKSGKSTVIYCQLAQIIAIVSVVLIFYNASMRIEEAYMIYFVLALPFIKNSEVKKLPKGVQS